MAVDGHTAQGDVMAGAENAQGNLAAIGAEHLWVLDEGCVYGLRSQ